MIGSIYTINNPYGYKLNINHPQVRPLYDYYKQKYNIVIMSDNQRLDFEQKFFELMRRKANEQSNTNGTVDS